MSNYLTIFYSKYLKILCQNLKCDQRLILSFLTLLCFFCALNSSIANYQFVFSHFCCQFKNKICLSIVKLVTSWNVLPILACFPFFCKIFSLKSLFKWMQTLSSFTSFRFWVFLFRTFLNTVWYFSCIKVGHFETYLELQSNSVIAITVRTISCFLMN